MASIAAGAGEAPEELAQPDTVYPEAAKAAGLRYVSDQSPGIRRRRAGKGFSYTRPDGSRLTDADDLRRIKALAIPPAWTDVWICSYPNGHIQATGRDDRDRKQYRYHARWAEVRDEAKYGRTIAFGEALPAIRARTAEHLALPGLPREKVLATVVQLLEATLIRVGNEEYARTNGSVGLTTMRDKHVAVDGSRLRFEFRGKSGVEHRVDVRDRRLARLVKRCQDLPGEDLFQCVDEDGTRRPIGSADVNAYLREISGQEFTAKDFRTWAGTVLAALALEQIGAFESGTEAKRGVVRAVEQVAKRLGNTPSVCRACYIHPAVLEAYLDGNALDTLDDGIARELAGADGLDPDEARVLRLLRRRLAETPPAETASPARRPAKKATAGRGAARPPGRTPARSASPG